MRRPSGPVGSYRGSPYFGLKTHEEVPSETKFRMFRTQGAVHTWDPLGFAGGGHNRRGSA